MNDWYKILGTARDVDEAQIKAAYDTVMKMLARNQKK